MDVFGVHERLVADYDAFTSSLVHVRDPRIASHLAAERESKARWPEPWLSLNPSFEPGGTPADLIAQTTRDGPLLHPGCEKFFRVKKHEEDSGERPLTLHRHQFEAIRAAREGGSYVLTTGTGSGKSLGYIVPIVDSVLRDPVPNRIKAIVVYPMNALANSQLHELKKYLTWGVPASERTVSFERYTGQENDADRIRVLERRPDILLTNYVMLEYLLTRPEERRRLIGAAQGLRFLVLDELHTYRGRQGSDVALLVRRLRDACSAPNLQCVGTSATMVTETSFDQARETVANTASTLFGVAVGAHRVIGETLRRATDSVDVNSATLTSAVVAANPNRPAPSYAELVADPLASWIETTFGLAVEDGTQRLVRQRPNRIVEAAEKLARDTGRPVDQCAAAIEATLQAGAKAAHPITGQPLFAFRLHQFFSKGDTLYVSLETEAQRHITSQYQVSVPNARNKSLLPLAFCRECGQEYLVVARAASKGTTSYLARRDRDAEGGDAANGYLYVSEEHPWPVDPIGDGRLPDTWYDTADSGSPLVLPRLADHLPREVWVSADGAEVEPGAGLRAWYVPSPFRFCLRCRVSYEQVRGKDFAKLASFEAEGRSSAVSLLSASIVRSLRRQKGLPEEARKLLTFVDNRQDASLQAGHFNDFVQVTQVRGALFRALREAGPTGLEHDEVAQRVEAALALPVDRYAQNPDVRFGQKEQVRRALRQCLAYRIYSDLERGWRVTMPNLEQTGLLLFDYLDLDDIAAAQECWANTHPLLRDDSVEHRGVLSRIVLDEMRRSLAVDVDVLTADGFERLGQQSDQLLAGTWALAVGEPRVAARTVFGRPSGRGGPREAVHFSGRTALGRYLRRPREFSHADAPVTVADAQAVIEDLLRVLEKFGLLAISDESRDGWRGYQVKAATLRWRVGDGRSGAPDPLRKVVDPEVGTHVNEFFRDLYEHTAVELGDLYAREHTAQVPAEDRVEREDAFREGRLPLLYCSPTMELGVDIATLATVAMRNVPPTPANYAQRSGRAGRSGQPALVTTYCSTGSAHDQYYFRRSEQMVAGSVRAPRLDLTNEDLIRSHLHAIWLAETGASLGSRMTDMLDAGVEDGREPPLPVHPHLAVQLSDPAARRRAETRGSTVLAGLRADLDRTTWWHPEWVSDVLRAAYAQFDDACERWRRLYRAALVEQRDQNQRVLDNSTTQESRRVAQRRRMDAENQLRLLKNEDSDQPFSDFYSYRYLASEGFLPGYSFPRLPLAAYVPGQRQRGTYIQRPRFIAVGEFGPGALIYHEGQRYQVTKVQVPAGAEPGDVATTESRVCGACGYWHDRRAGLDRCEGCQAELAGALGNLMQLQTVHTVRRRRISSDEEERRRAGFDLQTVYRFSEHGLRSGRLSAEIISSDQQPLAKIDYGDTATVRVINRGRRRRRDLNDLGFWLDPVRGRWLSESQASDRTPEEEDLGRLGDAIRAVKVLPYVEDRKNIAVFRLADPVSDIEATTLRYALERGIETLFQLEDAELASESLPDRDGHARMLFVESAEGGAGVLRRLHDESDALARAAREALRIIHVDPESGADQGSAPGAAERCERGCYDCLLSYSNQLYHRQIDRLSAVATLRALAGGLAESTNGTGNVTGNRADRHAELGEAAASDLERRLLTFLREGSFRLPHAASALVADALARPDFVYHLSGGSVAVFVDGPHHDAVAVAQRDAQAEDRLMDLGWLVIRLRHDEDWGQIVAKYPSVFGVGRSS